MPHSLSFFLTRFNIGGNRLGNRNGVLRHRLYFTLNRNRLQITCVHSIRHFVSHDQSSLIIAYHHIQCRCTSLLTLFNAASVELQLTESILDSYSFLSNERQIGSFTSISKEYKKKTEVIN